MAPQKSDISKLCKSPALENFLILSINGPLVSSKKFLETLASKSISVIASIDSLENVFFVA